MYCAERKCRKKATDNAGHPRGKTVYSVGEICAVDDTDHQKNGKNIVKYSKLKLKSRKWDAYRGVYISCAVERKQIKTCRDNLKREFLIRQKPLIFLFKKLATVVDYSDKSVYSCESERKCKRLHLGGVRKEEHIDRHSAHNQKGCKNKRNAPHRGSSVFGFMPTRTYF